MNRKAATCSLLVHLIIVASLGTITHGVYYENMPPAKTPPPPPPPTTPPAPNLPSGVFTGYYDVVVTEFSYKIWNSFMILSIIILFFSIGEAIYFSKVNYVPVPADYSYDYLQKRSMAEPGLYSFWTKTPLSASEADRIVDSLENLQDFDDYI